MEGGSEYEKLRSRQAGEALTLHARQVEERRETARKEGLLTPTLEGLDKNLIWKQETSYRGYKSAYGYDVEKMEDTVEAYYCERCDGWVKGGPEEHPYNSIQLLAGSEGVNYNCGICDNLVGQFVSKMS